MAGLGEFLKERRKLCGLTLRDVESQTKISNAYLSQLENGKRKDPHVGVLRRLASVYSVNINTLIALTGEIEACDQVENEEERINRVFDFVRRDPQFKYGTRIVGPLTTEAKRFIIELYEQSTGRELLTREPDGT